MCNEKKEPDTKTSLFRFTHPLKPIGVILPQGVSKEDYNRSTFVSYIIDKDCRN